VNEVWGRAVLVRREAPEEREREREVRPASRRPGLDYDMI
jgi:hypothetical protein